MWSDVRSNERENNNTKCIKRQTYRTHTHTDIWKTRVQGYNYGTRTQLGNKATSTPTGNKDTRTQLEQTS